MSKKYYEYIESSVMPDDARFLVYLPTIGSQNVTAQLLRSEINKLSAGTAAAPSLTFAGDTNTGIYASGADAIGISTAGVARLQIAADGGVGVGTAPVAGRKLNIGGTITGAVSSYGQVITGTFQSDVTSSGIGITTYLQTQAAAFTLPNLYHYLAQQGTIGAGSTVTAQNGFIAAPSLIGATNNYGFRGQIPSGTGRWNLYMDGTAINYLNGALLLGTTTDDAVNKLQVTGDTKLTGNLYVTGATALGGTLTTKTTLNVSPVSTEACAVQIGHGRTNDANAYVDLVGDATYTDYGARLIRSLGANGNTSLVHRGTGLLSVMAQDAGVVGLGTANTVRVRVEADGKVGVGRVPTTNALEVQGAISVWGTAASIGYAVGTGGAATQTTSRTTGVTLNKINGSITLVSAAGSTTWQSFTVTNSMVAATDIITVCQKSGTDLYQIHVTNVAAGSFQITFATTGGTTTEQPVFNFTIIKGVNS